MNRRELFKALAAAVPVAMATTQDVPVEPEPDRLGVTDLRGGRTVVFELDGRELARHVADELPRILRRL